MHRQIKHFLPTVNKTYLLYDFSANFATQASHLMAGVRGRRTRTGESVEETVNTIPAKWPGETVKLR